MAGSKSVRTRGGYTRSTPRSAAGGVTTGSGNSNGRGNSNGGGNSSAGSRANGKAISPNGTLRIPGFDGDRPSANRLSVDYPRKGKGISGGGKAKAQSTSPNSAIAGDGSPQGVRSTNLASSSHDSNGNNQLSPPSQNNSNLSASRRNLLPLQYPSQTALTQRQSNSQPRPNLNLNVQPHRFNAPNRQQEVEDEEDDEEEANDEEDDGDGLGNEELVDELQVGGNGGENDDYEALLDAVLAHPGRQRLPFLSEEPLEDTFWFTRDRGLLTRVISGIFRRKFDGPFYSWTVTPIDKQERFFRTFASNYNWDVGITPVVRAHFNRIAIKRMRGIVSQVRTRKPRVRPIWISDEKLWATMCAYWATTQAQEKSTTASNSRNSDRNGRGPHKHRTCQSSYLTIQQDMEQELQRPVSWGEVFVKTHTLPDGSFIDLKAQEVNTNYENTLREAMEQPVDMEEDSDNSSQRNLTVEEKNEIFLKCTEFDPKGTPYGVGQLSHMPNKGKRKISYGESSSQGLQELQEELKAARQKISDQDATNLRRDAENARLAQDLKASQDRITELENKMVAFMQLTVPTVQQPSPQIPVVITPPSASDPPCPANGTTEPPK